MKNILFSSVCGCLSWQIDYPNKSPGADQCYKTFYDRNLRIFVIR